ncbi:hypothetical protein BJ986_001059 [Phycicoccus badiiscoriae]|uniref:Uncharacterized protein n=1 Tax=Pedococcus badiiscoriae TaxID=642776 RepID=A0A852WMR0_9MICO|nr:hypothetical protein [Pedococcus badiiscoriae]NYG06572.1 hypothetical protein [Pedococcus badiiscoriae]
MRTHQNSLTFEQAVPRRVSVSRMACCLVLIAFGAYVIYVGIQFRHTLAGGYEVLAFAVPVAAGLVLVAAGLLFADRVGRAAWVLIGNDAVTLHSRGVLCRDVILPMTEITGVQSYPWQYASAELPRGAVSVTPLSMGPWLALSVAPLVLPARRTSWMWHSLFRATDFTQVRTPSSRRTCSMILFGTTEAEQALEAIRDHLPA